jgi:hypothetical protein
MSKPAWACTKCGMNSSRKSSVLRHINNSHSGNTSFLVTYSDYLAGVKEGFYIPEVDRLTFKKEPDYERIMKEEFCREISRISAKLYNDKIAEMNGMSTKNFIKANAYLAIFHWIVKEMAIEMRKDYKVPGT